MELFLRYRYVQNRGGLIKKKLGRVSKFIRIGFRDPYIDSEEQCGSFFF